MNLTLTCNANGEWSPRPVPCLEVKCPKLKANKGVSVEIESDKVGGRAIYKCVTGYKPRNAISLKKFGKTCTPPAPSATQPIGEWTGQALECTIVSCPTLTSPDNGAVEYANLMYGFTAKYNCSYGYTLSSEGRSITCQPNGTWSPPPPTCLPVRCLANQAFTNNATVDVNSFFFHYPITVNIKCEPGYWLPKELTMLKCSGIGKWDPEPSFCKKVSCTRPESSQEKTFTLDSTKFGAIAISRCNSGYAATGQEYETLTNDELDSISIFQTCGNPPLSSNDATGIWEGKQLNCRKVRCPHPSSPANGKVRVQSTVFESQVSYQYDENFTMASGSEERTGLASRTWSGVKPTCTSKHF